MSAVIRNALDEPFDGEAGLQDLFRRDTPEFAPVQVNKILTSATASNLAPECDAVVTLSAGQQRRIPLASSFMLAWASTIDRSRVAAVVIVAASVCIAAVLGFAGGRSALAKVQVALSEVKTASYRFTQTSGNGPAERWEVKLNGSHACRVDQPDGTYIIFDVPGKRMMEVDLAKRTATIQEDLPVPGDFNMLGKLTHLSESALRTNQQVPDREFDGKVVHGFVVEDDDVHLFVWADPITNLPLAIELDRSASEPGRRNALAEVNEQLTNFQFDLPLDEKLFEFAAPAGFAAQTHKHPSAAPIQETIRQAVEKDRDLPIETIRERTRQAMEAQLERQNAIKAKEEQR